MGKNKNQQSAKTQTIANLLTILVALAAIGLSIWEGRENRLHNRLSVMPHLERIESTLRKGLADSTFSVKYAMYNSGLGPAVLHDVLVYKNDSLLFQFFYLFESKSQLFFQLSLCIKPVGFYSFDFRIRYCIS